MFALVESSLFDIPSGSGPMRDSDPPLDTVLSWLHRRIDDPVAFFGGVVRKSIDEVLDGPRTGRWDFDALEKTEKTYVGTKLEIVLRTALGLQPGGFMDLEIEGIPVDIKWSGTSAWQIPREAVDQLCLCVGALTSMRFFQAGLVRCSVENLNLGRNQDQKTTISSVGKRAIRPLVSPSPLPQSFVAEMDPYIRSQVMDGGTIQQRVTKLFQSLPRIPIPRDAVRTVARTEGDPMRRIRRDARAGDPLGGYEVLTKYDKLLIERLGYPPLRKDEFMSVPRAEIERLNAIS